MITAVFYRQGEGYGGFSVSGHAGHGEEGEDIVCSAVSSSVMLVCNTVTDFFGAAADVSVEENKITLKLLEENAPARQLLLSFYAHLEIVAQEYAGSVRLEIR